MTLKPLAIAIMASSPIVSVWPDRKRLIVLLLHPASLARFDGQAQFRQIKRGAVGLVRNAQQEIRRDIEAFGDCDNGVVADRIRLA